MNKQKTLNTSPDFILLKHEKTDKKRPLLEKILLVESGED